MTYNVTFHVDNRESIKDTIKHKIPNSIFENLDIGDYLFKLDDQPILVLERKTIADYAASIKDGRNREQKKRLTSNFQPNQILYIIEGDLTSNNCNFQFNKVTKDTIISSMINTMLRDNIHILHTSCHNETIDCLDMILTKFKKQGLSFMEDKTTHSEDLIQTCKPSKKSNMTVDIGFQMMLNNIPNVSTKLSKRISEKYNSINQLVTQLHTFDNNTERINFIINIKMDDTTKGRKISKTAADNIVKYLGF